MTPDTSEWLYLVVAPNGIPWSHSGLTKEDAALSKAHAERRMLQRGTKMNFSIVPAHQFDKLISTGRAHA